MSEQASSAGKIDDLKARYDKDPDSRIFLQLAEEYRKVGQFGEAVKICQNGLTKHPAYTSARVTLARAHLGLQQRAEARAEFEKVIAAVPDNLLANRHLAELYYEDGRFDDAMKRYQVVAMLSPNDEEVASRIRQLKAGAVHGGSTGQTAAPPPPQGAPKQPFPAAETKAPAATAQPIGAGDDFGFMDLKMDESVILNADMVNAALAGPPPSSSSAPAKAASGPAASGAPAPPVPAPPVKAPPPPAPTASLEADVPSDDDGSPAAGEAELGEFDDFSDFSAATVMLNTADIAKIPGVMDGGPAAGQAKPAQSAPPQPTKSVDKFGLSEPKAAPTAAPPTVAPSPSPAAQTPAASSPPEAEKPASSAGSALDDELSGADDFSEFGAPTVMLTTADLAKAGVVTAKASATSPVTSPGPAKSVPPATPPPATPPPATPPPATPPPAQDVQDDFSGTRAIPIEEIESLRREAEKHAPEPVAASSAPPARADAKSDLSPFADAELDAPEPLDAGEAESEDDEGTPAPAEVEPEATPGPSGKTLAQLYLAQGHLDKARAAYVAYLVDHPEDHDARQALTGIEAKLKQQSTPSTPSGSAAPGSVATPAASPGPPPSAPAAPPPPEQPATAPAPGPVPEAERQRKMDKLSNWLDSLKRKR